MAVIDQRSSIFKGVMALRSALEDALGPQITATRRTRRTISDGATVRAVLLDHATRYGIRKSPSQGAGMEPSIALTVDTYGKWLPKRPLHGGVNAIAAGSRSRTVAARSQVRESVEKPPVSVTIA